MRQHKYEYDAFISHAVEDKIPIANELCAKLERAGLRIWYSGKELGVGDSIEKTIERGLNRSRYGIVIFSPTYLAKNWTIREFYTLLAKEIEEQKVILPVLYNITLDELKNKDLVMADRFAVNSDKGLDFVVERLLREIKKPQVVRRREAWYSRIWVLLAFSLLANVTLLFKGNAITSVSGHGSGVPTTVPVTDAIPASGPASLLRQMQKVFTGSGECSCCRSPQESPTLPVVQAGFSPFQTVEQRPSHHRDPSFSEGAVSSGAAKNTKMTMAVVFQIEGPQDSHQLEHEVKEILNTLQVAEKKESGRPLQEVEAPAETAYRGCAQMAD